jgi:hypothetical protein
MTFELTCTVSLELMYAIPICQCNMFLVLNFVSL